MRNLNIGDSVYFGHRKLVLLEIIDMESALVAPSREAKSEVVPLTDLALTPPCADPLATPLAAINNYEWALLVQKFNMLKPLLANRARTEDDVKNVAKAIGKTSRTVYRWLERYNKTQIITGLARTVRIDKGRRHLGEETESVIQSFIEAYYLTANRPSVQKLYERIKEHCIKHNLTTPHKNTVSKRVADIPEEIKTRKRLGKKKAVEIHAPQRGNFPGADSPNAVVQIDHTPVDIILVDSEHRLPIGRPYLTLALDVATKMVSGYYLSLDHPSTLSACLCISHAVQRKDMWLSKKNIDAEWPIHGKMEKIHLDNAKEFRGNSIKRACEEHGIILEWRPKGQPNYGPHIERSFRTYMDEVHTLEGTTFSSVAKKMDYDSEGKACMTLEEFDRWFAIFLCCKYHNKAHKGISEMAPLKRFERYVRGTDTELPRGFPAVIKDEEKFRLDFMPYRVRTVQQSGIELHYISYYAPVLKSYIGEKQAGSNRSAQYHCSYDPRDLSYIYFYDAEAKVYHKIPCANGSRPPISLWEYRAVSKRIRSHPDHVINEDAIYKGHEEMECIRQEAIAKTNQFKSRRAAVKRQLRTAERRLGWAGVHQQESTVATLEIETEVAETEDMIFEPFDDIDLR